MLWGLLLGGLGAIFGSFIGAIAVRWPAGQSVRSGRSHCDNCGRALGPLELMPVLSFVVQCGRCRACGARIDRVQVAAELIAITIGALPGALLSGGDAMATAAFGWLLLPLAILDAQHFWLPDRLTLALAGGGLIAGTAGIGPGIGARITGGIAGFLALWLIAAGYRMIRNRDGLGAGDPKLLGAIGLWIGWRLLPVVVVIACMIGFGVVLFRIATGRGAAASDRLAFGTLLAAAAYPTWLAMLWIGQ